MPTGVLGCSSSNTRFLISVGMNPSVCRAKGQKIRRIDRNSSNNLMEPTACDGTVLDRVKCEDPRPS